MIWTIIFVTDIDHGRKMEIEEVIIVSNIRRLWKSK